MCGYPTRPLPPFGRDLVPSSPAVRGGLSRSPLLPRSPFLFVFLVLRWRPEPRYSAVGANKSRTPLKSHPEVLLERDIYSELAALARAAGLKRIAPRGTALNSRC